MTAVELDRVVAGYGAREVLHGISLTVDEGELLSVLGTNGAGKSTLLRVIAGLVGCSGGKVLLGGRDVTRSPGDARARTGVALAAGTDTTFAPLDVRTSLLLARRKPEYDAPMGRGGAGLFPELKGRLSARVGVLSSGERQLLALAQALVRQPKVLLVDELSRALSRDALARAVDAIRDVHARGTTVVVVDQSAELALGLSARGVFLDGGRVVFDGAATELQERRDLLRPVFLG
jgi:branched-chain amino acid transport system ATP-binding protein